MKSHPPSSRRTPGRPRRSRVEIDSLLRRHRLSGLSLRAFAREHDLCYATLLRWRLRAGDAVGGRRSAPDPGAIPTFIPIELEPASIAVEFVLNWAPHRSLRIPPGFDPDELRRLLDVLGVHP